VDWCTQKELNL